MNTAVFIIAEKVFRDEEYQVPKAILEAAGISVITASTTTDKTIGKLGLIVNPDILVSDIEITQLNALVFIGGGGASQYFEDKSVHRLAKAVVDSKKILGAICIAPVILANAGLLINKRATVFPDGSSALIDQGANYTGNLVEVDGNLITGNGPEAAQEFGQKLVTLIQ